MKTSEYYWDIPEHLEQGVVEAFRSVAPTGYDDAPGWLVDAAEDARLAATGSH